MRSIQSLVVGSLAVAGTLYVGLFASRAAAQDLSACGQNMYVGVEAQCKFVPPAECEVMCTPVNVEAACAAELSASCSGQCNVQLEASCNVDCSASCEADCNVNPGQFECQAECRGQCDADCSAQCKSSGDTHCQASCRASCTGSCDASCKVTPPSADCKAKCNASCSGSCKAKANAQCNIDCQAKGYIDCEARVTGGCKGSCRANPDGGLFCDGQFVKSESVDQCAAAIEALLDVEVQGYAEGSCANGTCSGEAGASCSSMPGQTGSFAALAGVLGLALAAFIRRRRA